MGYARNVVVSPGKTQWHKTRFLRDGEASDVER